MKAEGDFAVSAIKTADGGAIVRFYGLGKGGEGTLTFPKKLSGAYVVDGHGSIVRPLEVVGNAVRFGVCDWGIVTIKIEF